MKDEKRISICFFGITRNLNITFPSIENNIINPSKKLAKVKIFCHFYDIKKIDNQRSKEFNIKPQKNWDLFDADELISDPPDLFLEEMNLDIVYKFGDRYEDEFKSIKNILHQLNSLQRVFSISKSFNSDITIFARPDLLYLDSFEEIIKLNLSTNNDDIAVPSWMGFRGLNDRFSICNSCYSSEIYCSRIEKIKEYLKYYSKSGLDPENLLYYAIKNSNSKINFMNIRAKRVRANNIIWEEDFRIEHSLGSKGKSINEKNKFKRYIYSFIFFNHREFCDLKGKSINEKNKFKRYIYSFIFFNHREFCDYVRRFLSTFK